MLIFPQYMVMINAYEIIYELGWYIAVITNRLGVVYLQASEQQLVSC